jgi:photosystem II stability/assembly factor-like uncharacterized protein
MEKENRRGGRGMRANKPFRILSVIVFVFLLCPTLRAPEASVSGPWRVVPDGGSGDGRLSALQPAGHFETAFYHKGLFYIAGRHDMYLTGMAGVFRSTDGGNWWRYLRKRVNYFAVSPTYDQDGMLFASTSTQPALRSLDRGITWMTMPEPADKPVFQFAFSPTFGTDRTMYMLTITNLGERSLVRSTDAGATWEMVCEDAGMNDVVLSPYFSADNTVFARVGSSLWRSTDGGFSWSRIDQNLKLKTTDDAIGAFAVAPTSGGGLAIFALGSFSYGVTLDGGSTWEVSLGRVQSIVVPPDFSSRGVLFALSDGHVLRSIDLGASWQTLFWPGDWVTSFVLSPYYASDQTMYAGSSWQVWKSTDAGVSWQPLDTTPNVGDCQISDMEASPHLDDGAVLLSISCNSEPDAIWKSTDGARSWTAIQVPELIGGADLTMSPDFMNDQTLLALVSNDDLYKSTNGGENWTHISGPAVNPAAYYRILRLSPNYAVDQEIFVVAYGSSPAGLYRSSDDGETWEQISSNSSIWDFEISSGYPDDPTMFRTSYNTGLFRSDDGGDTWTNVSPESSLTGAFVTLSPAFPVDGTLFVAESGSSGGGVFRSTDRGDTWTKLKSSFFPKINSISPNFAEDQTLMVDAMLSEDAGDTWYPLQALPTGAVLLTYDNGFLMPLARAGDAVYRYRWPSLDLSISVPFEPGSVDPVELQIGLQPEDAAGAPWVVSEDVSWLSVTPMSGTFPVTMTLTIDPTQITDTAQTSLVVDANWSLHQTETITIPVIAWFVQDRVWLPLMMR